MRTHAQSPAGIESPSRARSLHRPMRIACRDTNAHGCGAQYWRGYRSAFGHRLPPTGDPIPYAADEDRNAIHRLTFRACAPYVDVPSVGKHDFERRAACGSGTLPRRQCAHERFSRRGTASWNLTALHRSHTNDMPNYQIGQTPPAILRTNQHRLDVTRNE